MPPERRHDLPAHSLDALVLQAAQQDYTSAMYHNVFRPSLVFHRELRYDPYHREYASTRNPLMQFGPGERDDDAVLFDMIMPRPPPANIDQPPNQNIQHHHAERQGANAHVRHLANMVINIAIRLRIAMRIT